LGIPSAAQCRSLAVSPVYELMQTTVRVCTPAENKHHHTTATLAFHLSPERNYTTRCGLLMTNCQLAQLSHQFTFDLVCLRPIPKERQPFNICRESLQLEHVEN